MNVRRLMDWTLLVPILILIFGTALFVWAEPGQPYNIFAPPEPRRGYDPLAGFEQEGALTLVEDMTGRQVRSADSRLETVLIERHQEEKSVYAQGEWDRRADVYVYDYATDELRYAIVNLTMNRVDHFEVVQGVQLPLTRNEAARAADILVADTSDVGVMLRQLYSDAYEGAQLTAEALDIAPFTFHAGQRGITDGDLASCGVERCAELLISTTADNLLVPFNPVVNLSQGRIVGTSNYQQQ